jgi:hypothetical protein
VILSLTRLRLGRWRDLPKFLEMSRLCVEQAAADASCCGGASYAGPGLCFWTATLWRDEASLRSYLGSGAHREAMPLLAQWCTEAAVAHFGGDRLPEKSEIAALLGPRAKFSTVRAPSPLQQSKVLSPRAPWFRNVFKKP